MKWMYCLAMVVMLQVIVSCDKEDDYRSGDDGGTIGGMTYDFSFSYAEDGSTGYVSKYYTHKVGNGFPVVIMADGYTQSDINQGDYHNAVDKAVDAMFSIEPMASLKQYFDIYEVTAVSEVSGITTKKRDTAFSTYHESSTSVNILGDEDKIKYYARKAVQNDNLYYNSLILVLVNSSRYAGVTQLFARTDVTDSIAGGMSIAYVPANCTSNGTNCFNGVLCHEAVGHGIGKLRDEYYDDFSEPTTEKIDDFKQFQKYGVGLNVKYDTETENEYIVPAKFTTSNGTYNIMVGAHNFKPADIGYVLVADGGYASEKLMWYQGGGEYMTMDKLYDGTNAKYIGFYTIKKNFYRPTWNSIMNSVFQENGDMFNALSRYLIYARVMKTAQGASENIHSEALQRKFMLFDKLYGTSALSAKGTWMDEKILSAGDDDMPRLHAPKIIIMNE